MPTSGSYGPCKDDGLDPLDLDIRRHVYFSIVAEGRPPATADTAEALGLDEDEVAAAYRRLHDAHALVLRRDTTTIRFANPFCFDPTPHRVTAGGRTWTGTCCWDALGIPAALHTDGDVATECACCGETLELAVRGGELTTGADVLCHILVPARHWWDDIGFT
jgi:hypothetical protein